jgi:hypothetical protein
MERRGRDFIGRSRGGFWCLNLLGINSGRHSLAAEVTAALMAGEGRRLTDGSYLSAGEGREKEIPVRFSIWAAGWFPVWAERVAPAHFIFFFSFLLFFFCFLISFLDFAY